MGNRTFRRHRLHFWPERVLQGLQSFFLQINVAEMVIHKANQMPWSTSLTPTACPARDTLRLILLLYRQRRPQLVTTNITADLLAATQSDDFKAGPNCDEGQ